MEIIDMVFIGEDGSLGYRTNHTYKLAVKFTAGRIEIIRIDDADGLCPYNSLHAFLQNWAMPLTI